MAITYNILGLNITVSTSLLVGFLVSLIITTLVARWRNRKINEFMASIAGPIPLPLIGTAYDFIGLTSANLSNFLINQGRKYPKLAAHWFFNQPLLVTGDLEIINAILGSNHNIEKIPEYDYFKNGCSGLFTSSGAEWRKTRKALTPGFRMNNQECDAKNYSYHLAKFLESLQKYSDDGEEHDLFLPTHKCALDLIFDSMFDSRIDVQKNVQLSNDSRKAPEMIFERVFNPFLWPNLLYSLLGKQKAFDETTTRGHAILREMLEQRIKIRNQLKEKEPLAGRPQSLMEVLLSNVDSGVITKDHALEELVEMTIAGSLTTANANACVFVLLGMFPDIQEKLYQEINESCSEEEVTHDDLSKLVYLEMVVKETLRHYTTPVVARQIVRELKVNDELTIPVGIRVVMGVSILHHDPKLWERPGEFYPEHFSEVNERNRPKGAYIPFLSGPRNCPGYKYAMQSIKYLVANTVLHYEFSTNEKPPRDFREINYRLLFMLWPAAGHNVQIKRRRPKTMIVRSG